MVACNITNREYALSTEFKDILQDLLILKSVTLPLVLYGCDTWSLILREEYKLRVFQNRMLRRIFVPKREEVEGGWRTLA
jgi:hypothetical protein